MATHFGILAWWNPRTEELGGLQSTESQRVGHDLQQLNGSCHYNSWTQRKPSKSRIYLDFIRLSTCAIFLLQNTIQDQCGSVAQSCLTLCKPIDCSMPGYLIHHQLPKLAKLHVYQVGDAMQPSHPLSSPSTSAFNLFPASESLQWVRSSHQVAKVSELQL